MDHIPELNLALGKSIRAKRQMKGFTTIEAFAEVCDLTPSYVSDLERGLRNPRTSILFKIASVLQLKRPGDLFLDDDVIEVYQKIKNEGN